MERLTERYDITPDGESDVWASTSFAVIAALSYTKEPLCLMALVLPLFVGLLAH